MKTSAEIGNISKALVQFGSSMESIPKNAVNPFYKNRYATLDHTIESVKFSLEKFELTVIQSSFIMDGYHTVETRVLHISGEWYETTMSVPLEKNTPQGAGISETYARRYGLSAALFLATGDDNDGNGLENNKKPEQKTENTDRLDFNVVTTKIKEMTIDDMRLYFKDLKSKHTLSEKQNCALEKIFTKESGSKGNQTQITWGEI